MKMSWTRGRRRRRRRGKKGRFPKPVSLGKPPVANRLIPMPQTGLEPIYIEPAEVEALRLVDLEGLSQEDAGKKMGVSRGTVWRLLQNARKKTVEALIEGRPLIISAQPNLESP
ncbi:MAG: DUF134 domain-containing protein [Thermoproteota archaeon]|nr:DUF134 domain-containing protein [Thermoproteota archaeon]